MKRLGIKLLTLLLLLTAIPCIGSPSDAAADELTVKSVYPYLDWSDAAADEYRLVLSPNADLTGATTFTNIKASEFTVPVKLAYDTSYYWVAKAVYNGLATDVAQGVFRTAPTDQTILYSNSFEHETVGSALPAGWQKYLQGTTSTASLADLGGNKAIMLNKTAEDNFTSPGVAYNFGRNLTSGIMTVTFDVYRTANQHTIAYALGFGGAGSGAQPSRSALAVQVDYNKHYVNWNDVNVANAAGAWYTYKLVADLGNRVFELYINNQKVTPAPVAFRAGVNIEQFAVFNFAGGKNGWGLYYTGAYYLDNVEIKLQNSPPKAVAPAHLAEDVPVATHFEWDRTEAQSYTLVIDDNPEFTSPERIITGITANTYTLAGGESLRFNTKYYWKAIAARDGGTWADDATSAFTTQYDETGDRIPSLYEVAPGTVSPDQTVQLVGGKLEQSDIAIARIADVGESAIRATIGQPKRAEDIDFAPDTAIEPIGRAPHAVSGVIPPEYPYGEYALWARNGTKLSNPVFVNRTDVYFVSPNRVNAATGSEISVIGSNLSLDGGQETAYVYLRDVTGSVYAADLTSVGPYELKFDLPAGLPAGDYEVWTHNGHGGAYGWGDVQHIAVAASVAGATYSITDFGAMPDDETADTAAIQAAVDAAVAAGGGTVVVPDGRYIIDDTIRLKHDVTLRGEGVDVSGEHRSIIKYKDGQPIGQTAGGAGPAMFAIETRGAIEGLKIVGSVSIDRGIVVSPGATDVAIRGNYIDNYFPTSAPIKGYFSGVFGSGKAGFERIVIENNTFDGYCAINFDVLSYSRIAGNVVHVRGYTPIVFMSAAKNIVENNLIDGRNRDGKRKASRGITFNAGLNDTGFPPTEMNYVAGNVISYVGDEVTPTNDGEYVLFDSNADSNYTLAMHYGAVSAADADSVTIEGVAWSPNQMKDLYVLIVEGKGLGQYRKVTANDANTLYLDRDWTVAPDYTSKATVTRFFVKNIVAHNTAEHNKGNNFMVWGDGIGNMMDGNVADTGGSSVVALDMAHPDMFFPAYYNVIRHAASPSLNIGYREYGRGTMPRSVGLLGNVIADSAGSLLAVNSNTPQQAANAYDNVIERNSVSSAITITGNAANTVLRQNRILGAPQRYADGGIDTRIADYPLLPPPLGVYTATYEDYIDIRWDELVGADGYYVMRSETPEGGYAVLNGGQAVTGTVYRDHAVQPQKLYYYKLAAMTEAYGQGDASPAAAGFDGAGVYASPLDYADTAGYRQWSYDDGGGTLAYADGQWSNADGSVALDARTTTIAAGSAIRQWTVPRDGKVHLYGFASVLSGDGAWSSFRIMVNDRVLADQPFTVRTVSETVYDAHEGDTVRFVLSGVGAEKTYASEFAVDYTRSAPVPAMPDNGTIDVDVTPLFKWTPAGGALSYTFELDDNPDMNSPVAVAAGVTQTQYAYGGTLEPGKTYYWRVKAHNGDEVWESGTPPASFTVGAATYQTLFAETYNLQPTGAIPQGYRTSTGNGGTILVKEVPGEFDKSLAISAPGNNSEPTVSFDLPQTLTSGKYEISWQSMYAGQADLHYSLFFGGGDVPWSSAATGLFAAYGRYYVNWQPANAFAVKPNVWQRVKVAIDLDTKQYAVYVDGQRLQLSNGANTFAFGAASIRVMTITLPYGRWSGTVYVDDIKVRESVD